MDLAYKMMMDERIDAKTRQAWLKSYTDASRVFIQALKAREEKDWEKRVEEIREYRRKAAMQIEAELSGTKPTDQSNNNSVHR